MMPLELVTVQQVSQQTFDISTNHFALAMAVARNLLGKDNNIILVIGDKAMTAGQAYEALNNAGFLDSNIIIVLNDNKQVSLPTSTVDGPDPVGALTKALSKLQASREFRQLPGAMKNSRL